MTEQNFTPEQLAAWKRLTGAPDAVRSTGKVEDDAALIAPLLPDSLTGQQPALPEPTQDEVDAFTAAWEAERQSIGRGIAPAGQKTRAGLRAAFAEHDRLVPGCPQVTVEQIEAAFHEADVSGYSGGRWKEAFIEELLEIVKETR